MKSKTMTTPHLRKSINLPPLRPGFLLIMLACFALAPTARAVDPPPDGGYPNFNTAEGDDALFSITTGVNNSALGFEALYNTTTGNYNNGTGAFVLLSNTT